MKVFQVIIHELIKNGGKTGAKVRISNTVMDASNPEVNNLIDELNNRYKNRNENYGVFDPKNATRFHTEFKTYAANFNDDALFLDFTKKVSGDLREKVDSVAPAKGGYLIYARYMDQREFVGIFLVRDTQGTILRRNSQVNSFDIGKVEHIDFEKMAMACRINVNLFNASAGRYLSFINKKSDSISKYFTSWISSTDTETNEQDTRYFYKMLKELPPPKDEQGHEIPKDEFFDKIYRHVGSSPERQINLKSIGLTFYNDENFLTEYAEKNDIPVNTEFKSHSGIMKRFIQVRVKADRIELAFPHEQLNNQVRIIDGTNIVITSPALVEKVNQMISGS